MQDKKIEKVVKAYLAHLVDNSLKRHVPGLHISLNMFTYGRYGKYPGELLYADPKAFITVLKEYFRDQEMVRRLLKYLLKPLEENTDGRKAINALINGQYDDFRKYVVIALKDRAMKWVKRKL